ncbi:MAG: hypothetical protein ABMB14_27220, partial [Myxococcota bacterium]
PGDLPEEAWWAFHRAWAWTHRTEPDAIDHALAELATARRLAPRFVRAIDLEAAIRADRGELDAAIAAYERSLTLAPDRGSVVGTLASLYRRSGRIEEADRLRERAAQLGDPQALWLRAQAQASSWRWWTARDTLATFFAHTSGGPAYEAALRLDAALARSIRIAWWTAGIGVVGVLLVPVGVRWRRRAGAPLSAVIAAAPHTWRDVARICSAIRHEVLKHHTSVLADVAVALDARDPEPARWVATRLFGRDQALDRLDGYLRELDAIGRANGVRLNLRDRDPVFGPLLAEVAHLRRLRRALRQGRGRRLAAELRTVSTGLNRLAYARLGRLVARLCVLRVDEALLRDVFAQVCGEFRDRDAPELAIAAPDEPLYVRMFRADLVDVLANLVRNAIEASPPDGGIGFALDVEEDPVTALDRVVIRVLDEAPGKLTTAMLRGRYVARGLGLAMDLTNRAGGSIHVEPVPEWSKGLVVRLPRAEIPDEED